MNLSQGTKNLLDLVKGAYRGDIMLPDFQRNFVWSRSDIEELLKSMLEKMFIGSFLIHNVNPSDPPFKPIAIEGAKNVNSEFRENPNILILDGQQRLSSFFYAMYAPDIALKNASNPYVFFIDIEKILGDNIEESVFSESKAQKYYKSLLSEDGKNYDPEKIANEQIIPLTYLIGDFTEIWYSYYKSKYSDEQSKKIRRYVQNIIEYSVLTLDVSINERPQDIAVLFERINRTGIKLSIFDLLVARLYKFINLRNKWEEAFETNHFICEYSLKNKRDTSIPYYFIQALALANNLSIKAADMLKIDGKILNEKSWADLVSAIENRALRRLLDPNEYGIARPEKWTPYSSMAVPFFAFYLKEGANSSKVSIWYWSSVFSERYSGSVDSKLTKDYKEVVEWFTNPEKVPEVVKIMNEIIDKVFTLRDKDNSGNAIYKGVFNLLFINDAGDFYNDDKIKFSRNDLDDHHIFPLKYMTVKGISEDQNSILNKTLIHDTTNGSISKKSPANYLKIMINKLGGQGRVIEILDKHFINKEMYELLLTMDEDTPNDQVQKGYKKFLDLREKYIIDKIKNLTNATLSTSSPSLSPSAGGKVNNDTSSWQ